MRILVTYISAVCLLAICIRIASAQASGAPPTNPEDYKKWLEQRQAEEAARKTDRPTRSIYTPLLIPDPIEPVNLEHFADILDLSDAQRLQFSSLHEAYVEWARKYFEKYINPLIKRSKDQSEDNRGGEITKVELAQLTKQVFAERTNAIQPIFAAEQRLFNDMLPFLTEEQLPRLDRVRDQRQRDIALQFFLTRSPGANLDLSARIWEMQRKDIDCTPRDALAFETDLVEYEKKATACLVRITNMREEQNAEHLLLLAQGNEAMSDPDGIDQIYVQSIRDRLDAMGRKRHQTCRAMHDLNRRYVDILAAHLPSDAALELKQWFLESSYPVVYPDPYDAEDIVVAALQLEDLSDSSRVVIEAVAAQYYQSRHKTSEAMVSSCLDWYAAVEKRMITVVPSENEDYQLRMNDLQNRRRLAADDVLHLLENTLTSQQYANLRVPLQKRMERIASFQRVRDRERRRGHDWPPIFS